MSTDEIKDMFINIIILTQKKYKFDLVAYQLMDNHVHLIIKTIPGGESISRIMQYLKSRFAQSYNHAFNRIGPVWNERFKDKIVEYQKNPIEYLMILIWYLAYNPVKSGQTDNPRKNNYGSINFYLTEKYTSKIKLTYHNFFLIFGGNFNERKKLFCIYEKLYCKNFP